MTNFKSLESAATAPKGRTVRVVVADDSELTLKTVADYLRTHLELLVVGLAKDGREAIEQVELLQPDLVLMDVQMPGLNGLHAAAELRKRYPQLPVVLMSVSEGEMWGRLCLDCGASAFVPKRELPLRLPKLLQQWFGISEQ